jgi:hypothetical protein
MLGWPCTRSPPRAGVSQKLARRIIKSAPRKIVYAAGNPTTLAPNAAQLDEGGYELKRVAPGYMFPQTPHIETRRCWSVGERSPAAGGQITAPPNCRSHE